MRTPVSILIPAKNERANIRACIESARFADEVVVVDSGSIDGTADIAAECGAAVVNFSWDGCFPKKKNWALANVAWRNEWVFILDADERITPPLAEEIARVIAAPDAHGYYVNRRFWFLGGWLRHCGYYPSWNLRLFRHSLGRYEEIEGTDESGSGDNEVHEHVILNGPSSRLQEEMDHYAFPSIESWVEKHNRYSNWEARVLTSSGGAKATRADIEISLSRKRRLKALAARLPFRPSLRFLYHYLLRRGFLDGYRGYVFCRLMGIYEFLSVTKAAELRPERSPSMTNNRKTPLLFLAFDVALTVIVFNVIGEFRGISSHIILWPLGEPLAALVAAIYLIDGYRSRTDVLSLDYTSLHIIAVLSAMLITVLVTFAIVPAGYELQSSRAVIALSFLVLAPLTLYHRRLTHLQLITAQIDRSFLFLGDRASAADFTEECRKMRMNQPVIVVTADAKSAGAGESAGGPIPQLSNALQDMRRGALSVEAIILRESNMDITSEMAQQVVGLYFSGIPTYTLELFHQVYWRKIPLYRINPTWLFQEGFQIARDPVFERLKRVTDVVLSALGLLLSAPVIAAAGLVIWMEDRGPVFFQQRRIGKNQVSFQVIKLRSMRVDGQGDLYTRLGDKRITHIGRFLRGSRLDELPQLWNVLKGDMSLIGPRVEWDLLVEQYERQIPCYNYRHLVKPGITGWAQVNFTYGASLEDTVRKLEYDLYYIRHFSFLLDASIVLKTIQVILFGKGR